MRTVETWCLQNTECKGSLEMGRRGSEERRDRWSKGIRGTVEPFRAISAETRCLQNTEYRGYRGLVVEASRGCLVVIDS